MVPSSSSGEETIKARMGHSASIRLYSSWFCPCAQRTWAALEELADKAGIEYEYVEIDPYLKGPAGEDTKNPLPLEEKRKRYPAFLEASPRGLVPAIEQKIGSYTFRCNDSLVCSEFLAEGLTDQPILMPSSPADKAKVRMFWEHCASQVIPHFYKILMLNGETREQAKVDFLSGLRRANAMMCEASPSGFFLGEDRFSLADLALGPWMQRIPIVLKTYRNFELPGTEEYARLRQWWDTLKVYPSFKRVLVSEERLAKSYAGYADGSATSEIARTFIAQDNRSHVRQGA